MNFSDSDEWMRADCNKHLPSPDTDSAKTAVFIGRSSEGITFVMGADEEWITTEDMSALKLEQYR